MSKLKQVIAEEILKTRSAGLAFAPANDEVTAEITLKTYLETFWNHGLRPEDSDRIAAAWQLCRTASVNWITPAQVIKALLPRSHIAITKQEFEISPHQRKENIRRFQELIKIATSKSKREAIK